MIEILVVKGPRYAGVLEAAHLIPVKGKDSDDARNGLVLCRNHHRALDLGLFTIGAENYRLHPAGADGKLERLGIRYPDLSHLPRRPARQALRRCGWGPV